MVEDYCCCHVNEILMAVFKNYVQSSEKIKTVIVYIYRYRYREIDIAICK